jgi:hypothetical protein
MEIIQGIGITIMRFFDTRILIVFIGLICGLKSTQRGTTKAGTGMLTTER